MFHHTLPLLHYSRPRRFSDSEDCYSRYFSLFPATDFSTSLNRFSRTFAARCFEINYVLWGCSYAPIKIWRAKNSTVRQFADPKSTLWALSFHNTMEIEKSKTIGSISGQPDTSVPNIVEVSPRNTMEIWKSKTICGYRLRHPQQIWWRSHHPRLRSVVPLGYGMGQVNVRIEFGCMTASDSMFDSMARVGFRRSSCLMKTAEIEGLRNVAIATDLGLISCK